MEDQTKQAIDWELATQLAGGKADLAKELVSMLLAELPQAMKDITAAYKAKDYPTLRDKAHKLHGATSYCGVPYLKQALQELEHAATVQDEKKVNLGYDIFLSEAKRVLEVGST